MRPGRAKVARENDFPVCGWQKPRPGADKSSVPQGRLEIGRVAILRRARVQPCHIARGSIRDSRGCLRTSRETANLWVSQKRTSAAKAVVGMAYGTAEAVPFVQRRSFIQLFGRCPRQQFVQNVPSQLKAVTHVCRALRSTVSSPRLHAV
jgi:hypothetical protein